MTLNAVKGPKRARPLRTNNLHYSDSPIPDIIAGWRRKQVTTRGNA
jgi:hypothetical protein